MIVLYSKSIYFICQFGFVYFYCSMSETCLHCQLSHTEIYKSQMNYHKLIVIKKYVSLPSDYYHTS